MASGLVKQQFQRFGGTAGSEIFPDPFLDMASMAVPSTMRNALYWCEYIWSATFGTYRTAMQRIIGYFLTDIEILRTSESERKKWTEYLEDHLAVKLFHWQMLEDRLCYGNAFCSFIVPFKRMLECKRCHLSMTLKALHEGPYGFHFQLPEFIAKCPKCGYAGPWSVNDVTQDKEHKIHLERWSPHEIEILYDYYSHDCAYLWRIPEHYKQNLRRGDLFALERADMSVIQAVHKNQLYRFEPNALFHMKETTLGGLMVRGWGLPRVINNFRQIWYIQVLRRMNEAIGLDYVIPLRVITPAMRGQASLAGGQGLGLEPLTLINGGDFRNTVNQALRRRRRDPSTWQVFPFPVEYKILGGDANSLAPRDLHDQAYEMLLNDSGVPVELYKGSLQLQTAPTALRLMESHWYPLNHDMNVFLRWIVEQASDLLSWESVSASWKRTTIADNLQNQLNALQLMMGGKLSGKSGLSAIGFDWSSEQRQIAEESREQAEVQSEIQKEMEQSGFAQQIAQGMGPGQTPAGAPPGAAPAGGQPAAGAPPNAGGASGAPPAPGMDPNGAGPVTAYLQSMGPATPVSVQDMEATAESLAEQLLSGLPESIKDSELRRLNTANKALHDIVIARMESKRRQRRMQAEHMVYGAGQTG